jgi:uncharacterized membrane protein YhdT
MWKYACLWLPMVFIAIANGLIREKWYGRYLSELRAHQLSCLIGLILFGIYIWMVMRLFSPATKTQALSVGMLWLGLTVGFEFLFGHYVAGHSWSRLLQDYNLLAGRLWLLILLWITLAPYIFYQGVKH